MNLTTLFDAVVNGEVDAVGAATAAALAAGVPAGEILNGTLIPAMDEVGRLFERQDYYIPEMLQAATAMQAGVAVLRPQLQAAGAASSGKVAVGSVRGDLHDIGKNLVIMLLEGAGYEVVDLGVDVQPERFVQAVRDGAQVIGLSAMVTTTMANMKKTIGALTAAGVRAQVKVMVGGAPLTQAYAQEIGADGYAPDASAAVRAVKHLLGQDSPAPQPAAI
jgi:5-methyltetrahydrofolate--homocysteine methyltransferase